MSASADVFISTQRVGRFALGNLSAGGALLTGGAPLAIGTRMEILVFLRDWQPLRLPAVVVRTHPVSGFAVAFEDLSPETEDKIHDAVVAQLEASQARARSRQQVLTAS